MNTATLTAPVRTIFRELPLALPEPMESQLARRGVQPWMIAETFDAFCHHVYAALRGDWLTAYEHLKEATPCIMDQRGNWNFLRDVMVPHRDFAGDASGTKAVLYILQDRLRAAERTVAAEALSKRRVARFERKWKRSLNRAAA